jgi:hypothetical protein
MNQSIDIMLLTKDEDDPNELTELPHCLTYTTINMLCRGGYVPATCTQASADELGRRLEKTLDEFVTRSTQE